MTMSYLSEHLGEIVDISGAQSLSLEALGLQQVFSHVRRVDQHAMQRTLFIPVGLEHDLKKRTSAAEAVFRLQANFFSDPIFKADCPHCF